MNAAAVPVVDLPLVSVIIVNFNYGRFLRVAVESVIGQTYPNIECIVVDNGSTDESRDVLAALEAECARLTVIRRSDNGWQSKASLEGLAASRGVYIIFMDADDVLLPEAVDMHIFAHLSLRDHVGFTSGDMLQVQDGQVVVASGRSLSNYIDGFHKRGATHFRAYRHPDASWPRETLIAQLDGRVHQVPAFWGEWVWSPTTGNCFRRDAVLLFVNEDSLPNLRTGTDAYFARGIGALCGSALIDRPTFVYRIHGDNIFTRTAQLNNVSAFRSGSVGDNNNLLQLLLVDHLIEHAERFVTEVWLRHAYARVLLAIDCHDPDPALPRYARRSRVARRLVEHRDKIMRMIGRGATFQLAYRLMVPRLIFSTLLRW